LAQPLFLERLTSYSVLNNLFGTLNTNYQWAKDTHPLLKYGLETAEHTGSAALAYSTPIVAPVLVSLDERLGLENRANQLLDKIEDSVQSTRDYLDKANRAVVEVTDQANETAKNVQEFITDQKEQLATGQTVDKLLDYTESFLDGFLPPEFEVTEVPVEASQKELEVVVPPKERLAAIGYTLPTRVKRLAQRKVDSWKTFNFRSEAQVESFTFVVDLIQYAADYVDLEHKKENLEYALSHVKVNLTKTADYISSEGDRLQAVVQVKLNESRAKIAPIQLTVEKYTEDVAHAGVKACIGVVAAVAHATEIARRQLISNFPASQNLMEEFGSFTLSSKRAILSLNSEDLQAYVAQSRAAVATALSSVIDLLYAYTPAALNDHLANLRLWQRSLSSRLAPFTKPTENAQLADAPVKEAETPQVTQLAELPVEKLEKSGEQQ